MKYHKKEGMMMGKSHKRKINFKKHKVRGVMPPLQPFNII